MSGPFFLGVHAATLDGEGRIQLPSSLRDEVNLRQPDFGFVATWEADGSLCIRLRDAFDRWASDLRSRASASSDARATLLTVAAFTAAVKCDKQGRIRVPDPLLELIGVDRRAKAGREVLLVGDFADLRIWKPEAWAEWSERARSGLASGLDAILAAPSPDRTSDGSM